MKRRWRIATEEEIRSGKTTDTYFDRTVKILRAENVNPYVYAEVTVSAMPGGTEWGVLAGVNDVLELFEGVDVDVWGLPEGTLFWPGAPSGVKTPVLAIQGHYAEFAALETPMLGFLCHTSGMCTRAARIRIAAGNRTLLSFGARRTHPAITPQVEYAAYIGGCDGVSCVLGAELLGLKPAGTMPHALVIVFQDHIRAWQAYDRDLPEEIPRIALTDTYLDEVREAILAAENVARLDGVRLDTTGSRRGNFKRIIQEVRWELDVRGFHNVKIFVSGGLNEESLTDLRDAPVDGYGVGGAISNAPSIDFAMDIVAIKRNGEWAPCAKRGKFSGRKIVWRCEHCLATDVTLEGESAPTCKRCGQKMAKITTKLMSDGKIEYPPKTPKEMRAEVLRQLRIIGENRE
ncbi:MAG: nicotinate phosphoribosyltransferase [Candidatus Thorarchaeota archaeon]